MADVFSRQVEHGGSFSSDQARLTFGTDFGLGMLVQSVDFNYNQKLMRVYEVGSSQSYLIAGRTGGTGSLSRVLALKNLPLLFMRSLVMHVSRVIIIFDLLLLQAAVSQIPDARVCYCNTLSSLILVYR